MIVTMEITMSGPLLPKRVTDREAMVQIANGIRAIILHRTVRGISATGKAFKGYSTKKIWVPFRDRPGSGRRLTPKGGVVSRTGMSMRFDDGYAEYKKKSRVAGQLPAGGAASGPNADVDLHLSGELMKGLHEAQADDDSVVIQTSNSTQAYAAAVNDARPFLGLAPDDMPATEAIIEEAVGQALRRMGFT